MENSSYGIVYLLRKTSLTLAEIKSLSLEQFQELFVEVSYQESVEEYQTAGYIANLLAAIANTVPRKSNKVYRVSDFLKSQPPKRSGVADPVADAKLELEDLAKKFSIRLPIKEIIEL